MKKIIIYLIFFSGFLLLFNACQYKFNIRPAEKPPEVTDTLSFSQDVLPIWNTAENCVSCHKSGGQQPDLTPEKAYAEITGMHLVDLQVPEQSIIYLYPHPDTQTHTWKKYTASEAALILQWIEQGALNN